MSKGKIARICLGLLWVGLGLSSVVVWWLSGVPAAEVPQYLADWLERVGTTRAVVLFLLLYTLRPLILFPSSVMGIASGLTFGPVLGCAVTMAGELLGATLAFSLARFLGRRWIDARLWPRFDKWNKRAGDNGVLSVCVLRLIWLPYDTVSYLCGLTRIRLADFVLGTALGSIFYVLSMTLLGGSASVGLVGEIVIGSLTVSHRALLVLVSVLSFAVGIVLAVTLRRRFKQAPVEAGSPA
ncbi:TVP38/TMEM64 family inner membrane protein YdjZ [Planctomycetes bacterium Pan216]|uniref:TVP38/TMEM64 family membrane protein n=1 Tax=Kolteria novifilia TaxID=2527975 RepID=A0A518AYU9_9BACT|nr:TVP38/TMEM64 family inner membrane protein YdjZ [Planctomycetes bacterium Pan216]